VCACVRIYIYYAASFICHLQKRRKDDRDGGFKLMCVFRIIITRIYTIIKIYDETIDPDDKYCEFVCLQRYPKFIKS